MLRYINKNLHIVLKKFKIKLNRQLITNHWREIFDPAAQIFLNSNVKVRSGISHACLVMKKDWIPAFAGTTMGAIFFLNLIDKD
jgi:hypothetical protein